MYFLIDPDHAKLIQDAILYRGTLEKINRYLIRHPEGLKSGSNEHRQIQAVLAKTIDIVPHETTG